MINVAQPPVTPQKACSCEVGGGGGGEDKKPSHPIIIHSPRVWQTFIQIKNKIDTYE